MIHVQFRYRTEQFEIQSSPVQSSILLSPHQIPLFLFNSHHHHDVTSPMTSLPIVVDYSGIASPTEDDTFSDATSHNYNHVGHTNGTDSVNEDDFLSELDEEGSTLRPNSISSTSSSNGHTSQENGDSKSNHLKDHHLPVHLHNSQILLLHLLLLLLVIQEVVMRLYVVKHVSSIV